MVANTEMEKKATFNLPGSPRSDLRWIAFCLKQLLTSRSTLSSTFADFVISFSS